MEHLVDYRGLKKKKEKSPEVEASEGDWARRAFEKPYSLGSSSTMVSTVHSGSHLPITRLSSIKQGEFALTESVWPALSESDIPLIIACDLDSGCFPNLTLCEPQHLTSPKLQVWRSSSPKERPQQV